MTFFALALAAACCGYIILIQSHTGPTWLFSPPVLMVAYFSLVNLPGLILIDDPQAQNYALLAHCVWMMGVAFSCLLFSRKTRNVGSFVPSHMYSGNVPTFYIFIALGLLAFVVTFVLFGRAPLLIAINTLFGGGDGLTMHQARQMNTLENRNSDTVYFGAGYLKQIYTVVSPVFCTALYLFHRIRLRAKASLVVRFFMFVFVVAAAMNGQIWVAAYVIILFALAKYLADILTIPGFDTAKLIRKGLFAYAALLAFVVAYRYLQFLQGRHFQDFWGDTFGRIYAYNVSQLFLMFGNGLPFRYGETWLNDIKGVLPGSIQSFAYEVNYLIHGAWGFTLSPGIVASSYVNFGYVGIAVTACTLTAIFTTIYNRLIQSRDVLCLALAIYVSFVFLSGMPGDLNSYLVSLLTVFFIYIAYRFSAATFDPRKRKSREAMLGQAHAAAGDLVRGWKNPEARRR